MNLTNNFDLNDKYTRLHLPALEETTFCLVFTLAYTMYIYIYILQIAFNIKPLEVSHYFSQPDIVSQRLLAYLDY